MEGGKAVAGLAILLMVCVAGWIIYCILEYLPRRKALPRLYLLVAQAGENLEWLVRHACRRAHKWELAVVYSQRDEAGRILERLATLYGISLLQRMPSQAGATSLIDQYSTTQSISAALREIEDRKPKPKRRKWAKVRPNDKKSKENTPR